MFRPYTVIGALIGEGILICTCSALLISFEMNLKSRAEHEHVNMHPLNLRSSYAPIFIVHPM